jgi:3-methyladenine DNA glycosylase AlkD
MAADTTLITTVRQRLAEAGNPVKAPTMQAYMKSSMPYRGVPAPGQRALASELFKAHPLPDRDTWRATVLELWRAASYREERYLAIALTGIRAYREYQDPGELPLYEELIVTGAWWDYVDEVAIRRVGPILRGHREELTPVLRAWARDADPWKRRTAVICQVGAKADTDLALLDHAIANNTADTNFFLRKAIGWALRDYAWYDPDWVRRYVSAHPDLSGLSRREAIKNLRD